MSLFQTIKALLPNAAAWRIVTDKALRRLLLGLSEAPDEAREAADEVFLDTFPATTRQLSAWERQFGLRGVGLVEDRIRALEVAWKASGGQSPRYIQDILQAAGFDLYVHEWWASGPGPYVAHDPRDYTDSSRTGSFQCFDGLEAPECFDGPGAPYCNDFLAGNPGYLVNLDLTPRAPPPIPSDPNTWPFFVYIGAETFPDRVEIPGWRRAELEDLVLRLKPAQQWVVMLVDYLPSITTEEGRALTTEGERPLLMIES